MKQAKVGDKAPSKPSGRNILGASSLQIGEDDASHLIGGIVEKGFSEQPQSRSIDRTSAPLPTVLPFPVARHRSHGPHWAPRKGNEISNGDEGDDDDDGEEENISDYQSLASFANPVQRKKKKGLDLSQWKKLTSSSSTTMADHNKNTNKVKVGEGTKIQEKLKLYDGARAEHVIMEDVDLATLDVVKKQEHGISNMAIDDESYNLKNRVLELRDQTMQVDLNNRNISKTTSSYSSKNLGENHVEGSLESQIDAENRARLERMSADEIAEVQTEIMTKMSPALIKALQKRGKDKLKKQEGSSSDIASSGEAVVQKDEKLLGASTRSETDTSYGVATASSKDRQGPLGNTVAQEKSSGSSSLWDAWSQRVEAVRELRFSLDGNVIESDFLQMTKSGNMPANGGYIADNVSERDFLRTEGDPSAMGYTIKEALALTRSVIPGQRALALHLLASVLDKALHGICQNEVGHTLKCGLVDWEAIWAFVLGPEPELALSLRMCLDDNHNSVVVACLRVIQSVFSCDINENFFDVSEKIATHRKDVHTAPVFRSRPKIDVGFLQGGFWKYNMKPSNIVLLSEDGADDKSDGEHTIQDDIVVAGQDFIAGLVRMGILPRLRYLLESDPSTALEESIMSVLIAIARHSPTCAEAIMKCQRLVQTVINRFTTKNQIEVSPCKIKTVILFKVLARSDKKNCTDFMKNGIFQKLTWHLYQHAFFPDQWLKSTNENFKLSSALLVEQLRFWKTFIQYGYCVSYFSDLFPALSIWLDAPTFENLIEKNILTEFFAVANEAYLVLAALSRRLPNFYSTTDQNSCRAEAIDEESETWCWSHVGPMIDFAIKWLLWRANPCLFGQNSNYAAQSSVTASIIWVMSGVLHMLSNLLERVIPEDTASLSGGKVPWLPDFVPKIGFLIIKNEFFDFSKLEGLENGEKKAQFGSFVQHMTHLRHQKEHEMSLASVSCLNGLVHVVVSIDKLIKLAQNGVHPLPSQHQIFSTEDKILANGILESSLVEFTNLRSIFTELVESESNFVHLIEIFNRGGPSPGAGVGWGSSGGGFWSKTLLLAQNDARLLIFLLENSTKYEEINGIAQRVHSILELCLVLGLKDRLVMDKALEILLEVSILKHLDISIRRFLHLNNGFKRFEWVYTEDDYLNFGKILASHFRNRWIDVKKIKLEGKKKSIEKKGKKSRFALETIQEEIEPSNSVNQEDYPTSLTEEWAHQRLPLPIHWFLSPISTINGESNEFLEVSKSGLFFLLGIEAIHTSCVRNVPLIWKFHALSVTLISGMGVLEDEKSRDLYETLQDLYGQLLDEHKEIKMLKFEKEIHESYSTFIETLVEQFAAVSYGNLLYGRQIAIYLHRLVEAPVRLAAWNFLSNARALELLPPIDKCIGRVEGYLEPEEDDERILEAYVKSWVCGALDRASLRKSSAFTVALHHLSSFIFSNRSNDRTSTRNKHIKSLLRDFSRKEQHKGMIMEFIRYNKHVTSTKNVHEILRGEIERRFDILREACNGNSALLGVVEKLESSFKTEQI